MRLAEALDQAPTATLRRVADAHGLAHDDATTRAELIERIAERLGERAYLEEQLQRLADDERSVLTSARASAGELRGFLVDSEHPGAAEALADRGWLYRAFAAAGPLRGEVFVVPDEFLDVLPHSEAETPRASVPQATEPPASQRRSTDPAFSTFALVSALTRAGGNLEHEVRGWSEEPGGWSWNARWDVLRHLLNSAGLLVQRSDGAMTASAALPRLLDNPPELVNRLRRAYLRLSSWSEVSLAGIADEPDLLDSVALRRSVLDAVEQLPEAHWTSLEALSNWLGRSRPTIVREQLTPRGLVQFQASSWDELEAPLLKAFLLGPLYWLGMISTDRQGVLIARRPGDAQPPFEVCQWQGSGAELVAPSRTRLGMLLAAERYLVLNERARLSRYHLVQAHVGAALGTGGSIGDCRQLLVTLTGGALPSTVAERLDGWEQRFGALEIRPAVLLQARSEAELHAATSLDTTRTFVRARLGPETAEVAAADAFELAAALREAGHLPRIDAALRLAAEPRRAYAGMVDETVLEFLYVSLLAFQVAWPARLAELEGSQALLERLEHQFAPERLARLRTDADRLAGSLRAAPPPVRRRGVTRHRRRKRTKRNL